MQFSPIMPTAPFQPAVPPAPVDVSISYDAATVYLDLQPDGLDVYNVPCLIIGEGEAYLRWMGGDQQLRWLGYDAALRWEADFRLGTGQC